MSGPSAIGGRSSASASSTAPGVTYGRFSRPDWADIRDFGADPAREDNHLAIQAAIDWLVDPAALATGGTNPPSRAGTVFIPAGNWTTIGPVYLDYSHISIHGEGPASLVRPTHRGAAFLIGFKRQPAWARSNRTTFGVAGHADFTQGSARVTAPDAEWTNTIRPALGGVIPVLLQAAGDAAWYRVASVESDTGLTLANPYAGPTRLDVGATAGADAVSLMPDVFAEDHYVDCFGKLDSSVTYGVAGVRYGITGRSASGGHPWADHAVAFFHAPPCHADQAGWGSVRRLTIDACIEPAPGRPFGRQCLMGMGGAFNGGSSGPSPWRLDHLGGPLAFTYSPADAEGVSYRPAIGWTIGDDLGPVTNRLRVAVQVDLIAGTCRAWIGVEDGTMVEVATRPLGSGQPGSRFHDHEPGATFNLFGSNSSHVFFGDAITPSRRGSQRLYGFRLTSGLRYDGPGVGQAVALHADSPAGSTLDDTFRYTAGRDRDRLICCLDLDRSWFGRSGFAGRVVYLNAKGEGGHSGYFFPQYVEGSASTEVVSYSIGSESNAIRDLAISAHPRSAGAILVGQCYHPTIERVTIREAGWIGIGQTGGTQVSVYDVRVRDCSLSGYGAWVFVGFGIWYVERLARRTVYRTAVAIDAGNLHLNDLIAGELTGVGGDGLPTGHTTRALVWAPTGGFLDFKRLHHDQEWANGAPSVGLIVAGTTDGGPTFAAVLRVDDVVASTTGPVPLIKLFSSSSFKGSLWAAGLPTFTNEPNLLVATDGPSWSGIVRDVAPENISTARRHSGAEGTSRVVVQQSIESLPSKGHWVRGGHQLQMLEPASGSPSAWACTASGTFPWDPSILYTSGDFVRLGDVEYRAAVWNKNIPPPAASHWTATGRVGVASPKFAPLDVLGAER